MTSTKTTGTMPENTNAAGPRPPSVASPQAPIIPRAGGEGVRFEPPNREALEWFLVQWLTMATHPDWRIVQTRRRANRTWRERKRIRGHLARASKRLKCWPLHLARPLGT